MLHRFVAFALFAGLLFVGCADQSSVDAPITAATSSQYLTDAGSTSFSNLAIDELIVDERTGQHFVVQGSLACDFSKDGTSYTLATAASLTVMSEPDGKDFRATINSNQVDRGPYTGDFNITKLYKIEGLPSGSQLRIVLHVSDATTIESVRIAVGREEIGIEAE